MSVRIDWSFYLRFAILAAIAYCIPVLFFLRDATYQEGWVLYVGNFLFLFPVLLLLVQFNRQRKGNASSIAMLKAGGLVTIAGIIISCLLCLLMILMMVPGYLQTGPTEKFLENKPANMINDKTNSLSFMVFANAVVGNISTGLFIAILYAFSLKGDQTKEKVPPKQAKL
jgi:hypothetical protein